MKVQILTDHLYLLTFLYWTYCQKIQVLTLEFFVELDLFNTILPLLHSDLLLNVQVGRYLSQAKLIPAQTLFKFTNHYYKSSKWTPPVYIYARILLMMKRWVLSVLSLKMPVEMLWSSSWNNWFIRNANNSTDCRQADFEVVFPLLCWSSRLVLVGLNLSKIHDFDIDIFFSESSCCHRFCSFVWFNFCDCTVFKKPDSAIL